MGQSELVVALRCDGEDQVREVWLTAEQQVAAVRAKCEQQKLELRQALHRRCRRQLSRVSHDMRTTACARISLVRSRNQQLLAEHCWKQAQHLLAGLLNQPTRASVFRALVRDLPNCCWQEVQLHPDDRSLATELFASARMIVDPEICGGLLVRADGGRVEVDNRLETRLKRYWPELLTVVMAELRRKFEVEHDAS